MVLVFWLGCIPHFEKFRVPQYIQDVIELPALPCALKYTRLGSSEPLHSEEPNFIYKCFGIAMACPGGEPGTCAEGYQAGL